MTDIEILKKAYELEYSGKSKTDFCFSAWESYQVGASRSDITRLKDGGLIRVSSHMSANQNSLNKYRLTDKGINVVKGCSEENEEYNATAADILKAMDFVVGFKDIKLQMALMVEKRERSHILMKGPPASGKSALMDAIRAAVPNAYMAFGSRTSAAGIADVLFLQKPPVLLLDEAEKMGKDMLAVMLGLMQSGEIIETKSKKTRGIILNTQVIAACNTYGKFTPEFLSRFAFKPVFPSYTREEFIEVSIAYLNRIKAYPIEISALIGQLVFDNQLGDVRQCRGVSQMMVSPTEAEVHRVIQLILKYGPDMGTGQKRQLVKSAARMF